MKYYTDGACSQNGSWKGGWGVVVTDDNDNIIETFGGFSEKTTNNIMELQAFITALKCMAIGKKNTIYSDSAYICNCLEQKWYVKWEQNGWVTSKKEPVLNKELWAELIFYYTKVNPKVVKVKGHSDNKFNNLADKEAVYCKDNQCNRHNVMEDNQWKTIKS